MAEVMFSLLHILNRYRSISSEIYEKLIRV